MVPVIFFKTKAWQQSVLSEQNVPYVLYNIDLWIMQKDTRKCMRIPIENVLHFHKFRGGRPKL